MTVKDQLVVRVTRMSEDEANDVAYEELRAARRERRSAAANQVA